MNASLRGRRRWIAAGILAAAVVAAPDVRYADPRVHVRWQDTVDAATRTARETRYQLGSGQPVDGTTWRYVLGDPSPRNVRALIDDPAVADTGYIDRPTATAPERELQIEFTRARFLFGSEPRQLVQIQSVILWIAGGVLLWAAGTADAGRRRTSAVIVLVVAGALALAVPLQQRIYMGDADTYTRDREGFTEYSGVDQIRFEAHLSHAILGRVDALLGRTDESPLQAMDLLMRAATVWFVVCALGIGVVERWSPVVVRYLGLALLAPSTLLYFGYRELGHLSLNLAVFPLLVRGLRAGSRHVEAGGALAGVGAALHGFGLLSLGGAGLAALATRVRQADRLRLALRVGVTGLAAYLVWVAGYLIVLHLPVVPGHAEGIPWRPWLVDEVTDRVNRAILSRTGLRDLFFTAWVAGVPVLVIAASAWREQRDEVRWLLAYAVPSLAFTVMFWPIQGLAVEMDLIFAAFPALYAAVWVCARDRRLALIAAAVLVSAHVAFWRVMFDTAFVNPRL